MAKRARTTSEETIAKSWEKYNKLIDEQINKARSKGIDIGWQFERIESFSEYRAAYKQQQTSNRYYAERSKVKKYRGKENITRQLFRKSKIWTRPIISRYAKESGVTSKEARESLSKLSRQQLFDTFLELQGNDYDAASALYRSIVYKEGAMQNG